MYQEAVRIQLGELFGGGCGERGMLSCLCEHHLISSLLPARLIGKLRIQGIIDQASPFQGHLPYTELVKRFRRSMVGASLAGALGGGGAGASNVWPTQNAAPRSPQNAPDSQHQECGT
jgi:hypothetical protein